MSIPQCIILEIPYIIHDFDWVFLEIPVYNCIVGMLLTRPLELREFPQCNFWLEFPESMAGNTKVMQCGILWNMHCSCVHSYLCSLSWLSAIIMPDDIIIGASALFEWRLCLKSLISRKMISLISIISYGYQKI